MTNSRMWTVVIVSGILAETVLSITTNNVKKVIISGSQNAQSLTFSSSGEDQLVFRDATFQVRNDDSLASTGPLPEIDARETAESNWRPMYHHVSSTNQEKKLPREITTQSTVVVKPSNRTTKFYQFSELDAMRVPASDQVKRSNEVSLNHSKFASENHESERKSVLAKNKPNWMNLTPRMLTFEESDRMKFDNRSPEDLDGLNQAVNLDYAEPRILKSNENDSPVDEEGSSERNSSRFFRFEDYDGKTERQRIEQSPISPVKYYENVPSGMRIAFPKNDGDLRNVESHSHYETFNFHEADSRPSVVSNNQKLFDRTESNPLRFKDDIISRPQSDNDQFYTVKATIQIGDWNRPAITPPPLLPVSTRRPRKKKGRIYNHPGVDNRKQDGLNYQQTNLQDNYIGNPQQLQAPGFQYPPNPQLYPNNPYYQNQGNPNPQLDPNGYYYQQYLNYYQQQQPNPYQQPNAGGSPSYFQQPNVPINGAPGAQSGNPLNAQSIFGFLQSIFNFAPGTFGDFSPPAPSNSGNGGTQLNAGGGSPLVSVSSQLRKALDNIAENDDQQCVPKLICMMSRRSSGQGLGTYVNRGLLSTVLNAVPDGSPWLKFSRAALLGYGIGANSCDVYYPRCPKDESEIIYYLNNHRGGFFRFFNDAQNGVNGS